MWGHCLDQGFPGPGSIIKWKVARNFIQEQSRGRSLFWKSLEGEL